MAGWILWYWLGMLGKSSNTDSSYKMEFLPMEFYRGAEGRNEIKN